MSELLANLARWLWSKLLILLLLIVILVAAAWFKKEWAGLSSRLGDLKTIESRIAGEEAQLSALQLELASSAAFQSMQAQLKEMEARLGDLRDEVTRAHKAYQDASRLVGWWQRLFDRERVAEMERRKITWESMQGRTQRLSDGIKRQQQAFSSSPEMLQWQRILEKEQRLQDLRQVHAELTDTTRLSPSERLVLAISEVLPIALWTLLAIILSPLLIKAFLYFAIAPLISRARPINLLPDVAGALNLKASEISASVALEPGDALVVHSRYLQAAGSGPGKKTRWIFSWSMPFTSIAAGLYAMVVVRNRGNETTTVTVSPKSDLFEMIADIHIPAGSAMVVYPRSLVGIVMKHGEAPHISRHWRLGSLHSWITFQLRYIVIHGDCRLLVKGCRGVRAEAIGDGKPRMQDQGGTLGFSANLAYSCIRCETFLDYLLGRDKLFNDRFASAETAKESQRAGFTFTEEVPDPRRKKGLFGRGLEGLIDGLLKAFGI